MPVNSRHPDYVKMLPAWKRVRAFVADGRDGVKAEAQTYLPKPDGLDDVDYRDGYLVRAPFYGAAAEAAKAIAGALTRKPPSITGERFKRDFETNIDLRGTDLLTFVAKCCDEMVQPSRFGVLTDRPSPSIEIIDGAEVFVPPPRDIDRAYAVVYDAESIINWGHGVDRYGIPYLSFVVLEEPITLPGRDRYTPKAGFQWRVLFLDDAGHYQVEIYRLREGARDNTTNPDDFVLFSRAMPTIGVDPWTEIPFDIFGPRDRHWPIDEPLVLPVVNVNWDHYMRAADYVHSLHFTANPMPWAAADGLGPDSKDAQGEPLVIKWGSSRVLTLPKDGKVGVAEVTGAGAEANLAAMRNYEEQMGHLSVQVLVPEKRAAEAAETLELRSLGRTATLATASRVLTGGLTAVARRLMRWEQATDQQIADTSITMNTDYGSAALSAQDLDAIGNAHDRAILTDEDLFHNLERGERLAPQQEFEEWNRRRLAQAMARPGNGDDLGDDEVPTA